jgi:hypothetical protein
MSGVKGRSGRKKTQSTTLKESLNRLEGDIPSIIEALKQAAYGKAVKCKACGAETALREPDIVACTYLIDRVVGKPVAKSEVDVTSHIEFSADQAARILMRISQGMIESPQIQGVTCLNLPLSTGGNEGVTCLTDAGISEGITVDVEGVTLKAGDESTQ